MRPVAGNTVRRLRLGRAWLRYNLNTPAGSAAVIGGLGLGALLRVCWDVLLLLQGSSSGQVALSAEAVAVGLSALVMGVFAAIFLFLPLQPPMTAYTPPRNTIVGIAATCALAMLILVSIGAWLIY